MKSRQGISLAIVVLFSAAMACSFPPQVEPTPTVPSPPTSTQPPPPEDTPVVPTEPAPPQEGGRESIHLSRPGPLSEVTSPLLVEGISESTFEQTLVVEITDISGAVIAQQPATIQADLGEAGPFSVEVTFSIASDQPGRVSVYDISPRDGGLVHLTSANVTLLASGVDSITAPPSPQETIAIFEPSSLDEVSGGLLQVSGYSQYFFESNLSVAICGEGGSGALDPLCGTEDNLLATGYAMIESPDIGLPGPFAGEIVYSVATPTPARVVIYARSARDGGFLHLSSQEITLNP